MRSPLVIPLALGLATLSQTTAFTPVLSISNSENGLATSKYKKGDEINPSTTLCMAKRGNIEIPPNEFSRPLRTEIILGPRRKEYNIDISANEEELDALAKRFSLSKITRLDAKLILKRDRSSGSSGIDCIQVKGDVFAAVTQTCVRTNENFDVELEFNLCSICRASGIMQEESELELGGMSAAQIEGSLGGGGGRSSKKQRKKKGKRKEMNMRDSKQSLNDLRMKEIEDFLQDFDVEEDVVEDENIFGFDNIIDVGEFVAQSFRLKLDPYPKKPGSEPVSYSITG